MKIIILILLLCTFNTCEGSVHEFLVSDTTDQETYTNLFICTDFAEMLQYNASLENISIGCIVVSNKPNLEGLNHMMNYYKIDKFIVVIEPQTDEVMRLDQTGWKYYSFIED